MESGAGILDDKSAEPFGCGGLGVTGALGGTGVFPLTEQRRERKSSGEGSAYVQTKARKPTRRTVEGRRVPFVRSLRRERLLLRDLVDEGVGGAPVDERVPRVCRDIKFAGGCCRNGTHQRPVPPKKARDEVEREGKGLTGDGILLALSLRFLEVERRREGFDGRCVLVLDRRLDALLDVGKLRVQLDEARTDAVLDRLRDAFAEKVREEGFEHGDDELVLVVAELERELLNLGGQRVRRDWGFQEEEAGAP